VGGNVMIKTLYSYSTVKQFESVEELKEHLTAKGVLRISFRRSNVYEGTSRAFNEKAVENITEEDFEWLIEKELYGVRTLLIESQQI